MKKPEGESFIEKVASGLSFLQKYNQETDENNKIALIQKVENELSKDKKKSKIKCNENFEGLNLEILDIFIAEGKTYLAQAQDLVLFLEENPSDEATLQHLFRIFHTIKGSSGFFKLATLSELTHNVEHVLDELRNKNFIVTKEHIDLLLEGIDLSKEIFALIEKRNFTLFNDFSLDNYLYKLKEKSKSTKSSLGEILIAEKKLEKEDVDKILQIQKESAFTKKFGEIAFEENYLSKEELLEVVEKQKLQNKKEKDADSGSISTSSLMQDNIDPVIKVKASKVNFLVDMIGELIMAMGQLNYEDAEFMQVKKITRTLQNAAMDLRTDTLHVLFGVVKRAVRDLSKQLNKNVKLITSGEDLEIDRNLIEKLEAPLTHLIRNSLDHGLCDEETRIKNNKPVQGIIELHAARHGNSIVFSIRDDGRGMDKNAILDKAIMQNIITEENASTLTEQQIFNLIFHSGFSTKQAVTQVSGRGVGMDVVQTIVNENRGRIEIDSVLNEYTEVKMIFPLSTAIIDGMITKVSSNVFIFPIGSVIETIKITDYPISTISEKVEIATIREESIPMVRMHNVFNIDSEKDSIIGVICETSDKRKFIFVLDEVIAKREVVIKPLGARFSKLQGISSGTVLGGGKIGLVLDIDQIINLAVEEYN